MRGSITIGRIAGIHVYLHWTFILLLVGAFAFYLLSGSTLAVALAGMALIVTVFLCVVLHEFGHALMARRFDVPTRDITLYPIGGVARLQRIPDDPKLELFVAAAGPAVNVVIAAVLFAVLVATGQPLEPGRGLLAPAEQFLQNVMWINVVLVAFNLLPAFPMDGGRVLRALLAFKLDYVKATQIAAVVGQGMAVLFGFVAIFGGFNPFLLLIAVFVYFGAQQEASFAMMRTAIEGLPVEQAMITDFNPLHPWDTLDEAVRLLLSGAEQDFAVVDGGRVVGVLTRKQLLKSLAEGDRSVRVQAVMESACSPVGEGEMLDGAFRRMQEEGCALVPVLRDGQLVGLLTAENVGELVMVSTSLRKQFGPESDVSTLLASMRSG